MANPYKIPKKLTERDATKLKDPFVIMSKQFHNALKRRTHVPQGNLAEWDTEVGNPTGI